MRRTLGESDKQKLYRVGWVGYWVLIILINLALLYRMNTGQSFLDLYLINFIGLFGMFVVMLYFYLRKSKI